MLDRWSAPTAHAVSIVYRDRRVVLQRQTFMDRDYRAVCTCGWRSIETPTPVLERCPLGEALDDRMRRIKRPGERLEWEPYDGAAAVRADHNRLMPDGMPDPRD
jgi:hypothetical protein